MNDFLACAPIWLPVAGFLAILLVETIAPENGARAPARHARLSSLLAALAIGAALVSTFSAPAVAEPFGLLATDGLARGLQALLLAIGLATVALGEPLLAELELGRAEFHALLLASLSGMVLLAGARDLLVFFLGIELLSIPLYVLAAYRRLRADSVESGFKYFLLGAFASGFLVYGIALLYGATGTTNLGVMTAFLADSPRLDNPLLLLGSLLLLVGFQRQRLDSSEAAMKYFLLGAFASGFLLYGIALLYGATGTSNLNRMAAFLAGSPLNNNPLLLVGGLLLLVGFAFKVAAVPFHMWTPDAYEGAPTTVTGYMSVGAKAAGFAALLRVVLLALPDLQVDWKPILSAIAILTMTVGNVTALLQNNLKRMLAYSSIAHAGYVLVAVVAGGNEGGAAALFYLTVYALMNLGAFGLIALLGRGADERVLVSDLAGLGFRQPFLALAMTVFMISLGGIPPTAGFMGKFYVFSVAVKANLLPLAIIGVLNSVVAVFYYLRVTIAMYMQEPAGEPVGVSWTFPAVVGVLLTLALTIWWGIQAQALFVQAQRSILGMI